MVRRLALMLGCVALAAQAQTDWRFSQPDADFRLSVNFKALMNSPLVKQGIQQAEEQGGEKSNQTKFIVNLLSLIDRFSLSAKQKLDVTGAAAASPSATSDALMLITGRFDPQMIKGFFPSSGKTQIQALGPDTILIGEGASFTQALARMSGHAMSGAAFGELEQSDIWLWGGSGLVNAAAQAPPPFKSLTGFSVGVNLGENPEANMILTAANAAGAADVLAGIRDLMKKSIETRETTALLEKALTMTQEGSRVRFRFVVPPELLKQAEEGAAAASLPSQLQPLLTMFGLGSPSAPAAPKEPPAANGGKIVIYGLDDGPREVQPQGRPPSVVKLPGK